MAGALSEFGKKTTGYKVGVFVAAAIVIGLVYWQLLYKKTRRDLTTSRQDYQQLIDQSAKLDADAKEYKKKLAEADQLNKQIEENQKALPTEAELPAFFDTLGRKVGEAQVEVRRWDYLKEIPIESYIKVPIEIEITGTFYQIKRFFSSLAQRDPVPTPGPDGTMQVEDRERIVTIENLQIYEPKIRNRELVLAAKFTASTFRQDAPVPDKEDPAKAKKPAPAGGAAPPANTPAGAKAATTDALKQGEARSTGSATLQGGVP